MSKISEDAKPWAHWLFKKCVIFSKVNNVFTLLCLRVIVACLIYFPTAFNGVLKRLLRYIFPRIVSVVYKASSCLPGLFPLIEGWIKTTFLWILPTMVNRSFQWHENGKINRKDTNFFIPAFLSRAGVELYSKFRPCECDLLLMQFSIIVGKRG